MKRLFDITFSLAGLIIFLPLFAFFYLLVKISSPGPAFFIQKRIGRGFRPFYLYKFRTMITGYSGVVPPVTAGGDPRLTRIGRFLRRTKLDELPQLFNVLRGDMSLVGPRPELRRHVSKYKKDYREILKVRPGITDVASFTYMDEEVVLKDKKDPEEYYINVILPEKIKLAKSYVRKALFVHDLKLIIFTIFTLIYPKNTIIRLIDRFGFYRRPIVVGLQVLIFIFSNYLAFMIRFDGNLPESAFALFLKFITILVLLRVLFLFVFSLDKGLWRYSSSKDLSNIIISTSLSSLLFILCVRYLFQDINYPRSIYPIDWLLNIFMLGAARMLRRFHEMSGSGRKDRRRVIVVGGGDAAEMLIRDVEQSPYYPYWIVGIIDDDPTKKGLKIRSKPILGTRNDLTKIVEMEEPEEFLVAIPSALPAEISKIVNDLRGFGLPIKILPGLWGILNGRDSLDRIKVLEPEDILFRAPASGGCAALKDFFAGKRVMITGAGGSIGSEISRQVASFGPEKLILFERHEENLYKIDMDLHSVNGADPSSIVPIIGDVLDQSRVMEIMDRFRPEIVLHAAAYKHVPLMENNPYEAFKTNVLGTQIVAETAANCNVERFVLISTDKAVNPENVMGITKKIAEEIMDSISRANSGSITKYITVRFGNVLESSGSVVPLFRNQIKKGGPVTVTHPEITRYFMTIPEAVALVLQTASIGDGGEIFVLDMGRPVKILDLAKRMIGLYGYKPGVDIDIIFTGLRPGEKLHEELFNIHEIIAKTSHPKINKAVSNGATDHDILKYLGDFEGLRETFRDKEKLIHLSDRLNVKGNSGGGERI